jgi:transcriptional regulator NrdR family protein
MYVIKRDGTQDLFDKQKIIDAINKAFVEVDGILYETDTAEDIAQEIEDLAKQSKNAITVEAI